MGTKSGILHVSQMQANEQEVLHNGTNDGRLLMTKNINFSICKGIDNFLIGKSDYLFDVEKMTEFLHNQPDGIISMGCGAILSKKDGLLTYRRFIPIENTNGAIHHIMQLTKDGSLYKQATIENGNYKLKERMQDIDFYESMGVEKRRTIAFENNFKNIATRLAETLEKSSENIQSVEQVQGKTR